MRYNIVIVGGGIAGLEAARRLLRLGYCPIIVERQDRLGGHVATWHCLFPDMSPAQETVSRLVEESSSANIFLGTEISFMNRMRDGYNIMLSNGVSVPAVGFGTYKTAMAADRYGARRFVLISTDKAVNPKARNTQCSKVCCITAVKQAIEMKKKFPDAAVYCFYMDLRMFGKKYEDFYISAQRDYGIRFIRGRVSEVGEDIDGRVVVKAEDTLAGRPVKVTLDLLVLMAGMVCGSDTDRLASMLRLPLGADGFFKSRDNIGGIVQSPLEGIFYAGACTGPKTIPETLAEADSAALEIDAFLNRT